MRLICTLCSGVSKKTDLDFYTYDITKWCKVYTKTDSWFQKSHEVFGQLQTSSGKSKKLKFDGLLLSKKYIPSAKTLYTEDLSNITFNYLCENSPSDFLRKYPIKAQIFKFFTARVKVHQIPHGIFKQKVSFSSKFGSFFSIMTDISSVIFRRKFIGY